MPWGVRPEVRVVVDDAEERCTQRGHRVQARRRALRWAWGLGSRKRGECCAVAVPSGVRMSVLLDPVFLPIALALDAHDLAVVHQSVEQGGGQRAVVLLARFCHRRQYLALMQLRFKCLERIFLFGSLLAVHGKY